MHCDTITHVKNIGNAAGCPTLTFTNTIFGSDEYQQEYVFESKQTIAPGEEATWSHRLENTLINVEKTANLVVSIGEGYDQNIESLMPTPVSDVVSDFWYTDAIIWAAEHGIVAGYGDALFGPDDAATREQMAAIFYRYAQYAGHETDQRADLSGFHDWRTISSYAVEPISWACAVGLVHGVTTS